MKIDEIINKWFEKTENRLRAIGLPKNKVDDTVLASVFLIDNYLNNTMMILKQGCRLPAMALLRISGEFITKLIYCLKGKPEKEQLHRFQQWVKTSLLEQIRLYQKILARFESRGMQEEIEKVQKWIDQINEEIAKIKVKKELPYTSVIFEEAFGKCHPVGIEGIYSRYLGAVHLDMETLENTIKRNETGTEYMGDVEFNIECLKFECLTHGYIFFQYLYEYYNLDLQEIQNEYKILIPKS